MPGNYPFHFVALTIGPYWVALWKWFNKQDGTRSGWIALVTVNILFHLFLDMCTVYGTIDAISEQRFFMGYYFCCRSCLPLLIASAVLLDSEINNTARTSVLHN
jgi:hypothetical protein